MRSFLGKLAIISASASLICFASCERHKPDELHHGGHASGDAKEHGTTDPHAGHPATPASEHAAPYVSPTPAQFFPSPTP